jgi:hypothetical protein
VAMQASTCLRLKTQGKGCWESTQLASAAGRPTKLRTSPASRQEAWLSFPSLRVRLSATGQRLTN